MPAPQPAAGLQHSQPRYLRAWLPRSLSRQGANPDTIPRIEEEGMYHYDPVTALEELSEDAMLPNPVKLRDMMLRAHLDPDHSLEYNRLFVEYQSQFGEAQDSGSKLLEGLEAASN